MAPAKMHDDEVHTDVDLVRRLLATQHPQWADLPIAPVPSAGTDNALYRLGDDLAVRLPRIHWAVDKVATEQRWLPYLAPHLPLAVPTPVALGAPGEGYPWHWSVYRWLDGDDAESVAPRDLLQAARDLGAWVVALRRVDSTGGPPASGTGRGVHHAARDAYLRSCLARCEGLLDIPTIEAAWEQVLAVPQWAGEPVWIHGDLKPGNLLVRDGRLSAVIDFGSLAVGDPASDAHVAWEMFEGESRSAYREALGCDDDTWARGRGWALSVAVIALPYYATRNRSIAEAADRIIRDVLAEL